jgi:regulatory protein
LRLLADREHSRLELERKLRARGYEGSAVVEVVDSLAESGLMSEERMTEAYVAERLRKGFGPLRIRQELRQRGVADELIAPHLDLSPGQWLELMIEVADKKFGTRRASDRREIASRARFLEYRGFPADLIARVLSGEAPD